MLSDQNIFSTHLLFSYICCSNIQLSIVKYLLPPIVSQTYCWLKPKKREKQNHNAYILIGGCRQSKIVYLRIAWPWENWSLKRCCVWHLQSLPRLFNFINYYYFCMCQTVSAVQQSTVSLFPQKYAEYLHHFPSLENHYRHNTWTAQTQLWVFNISNHIHWEGKVQRLQKRLNSKKKEENAQGKIPFKIKGSRASLTMKYPEVRKRKGIEADFWKPCHKWECRIQFIVASLIKCHWARMVAFARIADLISQTLTIACTKNVT